MLQQLISDYGYLAIAVGCFFEGETVAVLGGFAAHRGYLALDLVIAAAFAGSFCGDQLHYYIGRRWGDPLLKRWPSLRPGAERARRLLARYGTLYILTFRFLYGLRNASAFVIGIGGVPPLRFLVLNMIAALVWASAVSVAGYIFGEALAQAIGRVKHYEHIAFAAIASIGALAWIALAVYRRRARRRDAEKRRRNQDDG